MTKEALIGEHDLKPLLTGHKEGIDLSLVESLGYIDNKPDITQVATFL